MVNGGAFMVIYYDRIRQQKSTQQKLSIQVNQESKGGFERIS